MKAFRLFVLPLMAFVVSIAPSPSVHASLTFDFSFTNTAGTVAGTVTGRILGLSDNSTGPASQVLIDTFPAGLNSIAGATPIDATLWDQQKENLFTTVAGQVVSGGFWAQQTIAGESQGFQLYVNGDGGPFNFMNLDGTDQLYVWGDDGFAAAHVVPAAVPEPAMLSLLGVSLAGLGFSRRKQ